jgi:hypothetical protein
MPIGSKSHLKNTKETQIYPKNHQEKVTWILKNNKNKEFKGMGQVRW